MYQWYFLKWQVVGVSRSSSWLIASTLVLISGERGRYWPGPRPIRYGASCDYESHVFSMSLGYSLVVPILALSLTLMSKNTSAPHNVSLSSSSSYRGVSGLRTQTQKWEWSVGWGPMLPYVPGDAANGFTLYHRTPLQCT